MIPVLLATALLAEPTFTVDDSSFVRDLFASNGAVLSGAGASPNSGRVTAKPARQAALATALSKPFTVVIQLNPAGTGAALRFGPVTVAQRGSGIRLESAANALAVPKSKSRVRVCIVGNGASASVFSNGQLVGSLSLASDLKQPFQIGDAGKWKGTVESFELYTRPLRPADAAKKSELVIAETKEVTIDAQLVRLTAVPDPKTVLPYKEALVTHEYRVISVKSGTIAGVQTGALIRVARWGIQSGKPTGLAKLKVGDRQVLRLSQFANYPNMETQFKVDKLPDDFDLPYLLDIGPVR